MLFNSIQFAIFLPIVFILFWCIPQKFRWVILLIASYYFYMSWNMKYIILIFGITLVSYFAGIVLESTQKNSNRKVIVIFTLIICLGLLFVFKYFNFFVNSIINFFGFSNNDQIILNLVLPVGISFYTFQSLSYVIDVYRKDIKAERNFGYYATFVSFFPQLVAGPIERASNLLPQIRCTKKFDYDNATFGMRLIAWGLFKKIVIADNVAKYVDKVFANVYGFKGFVFVIVVLMFTIQIYCDFSGYSDIAKGCAKLFNIDLMSNFKSPYCSTSFREFWKRWHISLSEWFKDYVYIPLGGNRTTKIASYFNLLITFTISGLWHGANWTFIIWGAYHGILQIIEKILKPKFSKKTIILNYFIVMVFVAFGWLLFRAENMNQVLYICKNALVGISSPFIFIKNGFTTTTGIGITKKELLNLLINILMLLMFDFASIRFDLLDKSIKKVNVYPRWVLYILFIVWVIINSSASNTQFIYFQF